MVWILNNIKKCTFDAKMTLILRIKLAGLDKLTDLEQMNMVIKHCKTKLKVRIHEEEDLLNKDSEPKMVRSKDCIKGE